MTRRINLIPPEIAARRRFRQLTTGAIAAGVGVIVILGLFTLVQQGRLAAQKDDLVAQESVNANLRSRVALLNEFEKLAEEVESKTALVDGLTTNEVRWSVVLADISLVIPSNTWLTTFTATVSATTAAKPDPKARLQLGKLDLSGVTFTHVDVGKWLVRLAGVDGFIFPYLSLSSKAAIGTTPVVNFTTTVDLGEASFRKNQTGARRRL